MSTCVEPNPNNPNNYVFDTNVLNQLVSDATAIELLKGALEHGYCFFITDVQLRELNGMPDRTGRYTDAASWHPSKNYVQIQKMINELNIQNISCVALLLKGFWTLDGSMRILDDKDPYFEMFQAIHNDNLHHLRDATIAEATLHNHCKLVSKDKRLRNKVNSFFLNSALSINEFMESLQHNSWRNNDAH